MSSLFKKIILLISSGILIMFISVIGILWAFSNKLPDYKFLKSYKPPVSSKVYSGEGELVSDFSKEKRIFVPYNAIPLRLLIRFYLQKIKIFFHIQESTLKEFLEQL